MPTTSGVDEEKKAKVSHFSFRCLWERFTFGRASIVRLSPRWLKGVGFSDEHAQPIADDAIKKTVVVLARYAYMTQGPARSTTFVGGFL